MPTLGAYEESSVALAREHGLSVEHGATQLATAEATRYMGLVDALNERQLLSVRADRQVVVLDESSIADVVSAVDALVSSSEVGVECGVAMRRSVDEGIVLFAIASPRASIVVNLPVTKRYKAQADTAAAQRASAVVHDLLLELTDRAVTLVGLETVEPVLDLAHQFDTFIPSFVSVRVTENAYVSSPDPRVKLDDSALATILLHLHRQQRDEKMSHGPVRGSEAEARR